MKLNKLSGWEKFWYYLVNFLTLGYWFSVKVVIKKALYELNETK